MKKIIALAPMDGITNCAYRTVTKELFEKHSIDSDSELWLWTEFMNVEGFVREPGRLIHHIIKTDFEDKTIAQIYGGDHGALIETAQYIDKYHPHFAGIELNIGCPSPKIMACGGGAGMMRDRPKTISIIKEIADTCSLPFSIKTRVGLSVEDKEAQKEFILDVAQYCRHIIIHGRTYKQSHTGDVDWNYIYGIKKELGNSCIVIGNGGIHSYDEMKSRLYDTRYREASCSNPETTISESHCNVELDGTMVGQAAIGRPWILTNHQPTLQDRLELIQRHAKMMIILYDWYAKQSETGRAFQQPTYAWLQDIIHRFDPSKYSHEQTMVEYRKYLFNYISGLPANRELKVQLATIKDYPTVMKHVEDYFATIR